MEEDKQNSDLQSEEKAKTTHEAIKLSGMFENWFLDYASYVILERAVPDVQDGLKPVQRRILHAMKELDDGRYNKVANIIGHTMKYHPHGDASIGDALVQLGQKDLLIDTQGNWGNVLTGDSSAAPRYIEARLSKLALDVAFNPKTTLWKRSYDGRNKEPVNLPVKFPLLLAQGVEGIAVGLASKILPHNFIELIDASIDILKGNKVTIFPDFNTGGLIDVSKYNDGLRGGRVRVRARVNIIDKKTLSITEIPFGTTTTTLIESIIAANDRGKIKVKKIEDNTAENAEILIHLPINTSPDQTIDALFAFTNCEMSISPNSCVIQKDTPLFLGVTEILELNTFQTRDLLQKELQIQLMELEEQWHYSSLEKIFIEKRIYRDIEECETWEAVVEAIDNGLEPYKKLFRREITREDIIRLTEIKIKRISKHDVFKADDIIKSIEDDIEQTKDNLANIIRYTINYFKQIRKKHSEGRERKTEIRSFENIEAAMVAVANAKLYVDKEEGFAGTGLKKATYVCDCSDIDDIIVFRRNGTFIVTKVADKVFVGKDVIHIDVFRKNDERTIYNLIYRHGLTGPVYIKRFAVVGVTRDKTYDVTKGKDGSRILYFSSNPNGEAEVIKVLLRPKPRLRKLNFEFDFKSLAIKNRNAQGNVLTKYVIKSVVKKEEGISTLDAIKVWFDDTVQRLNHEERGQFLGSFHKDDKILALYKNGEYRLHGYEVTTHFDNDLMHLRKFDGNSVCNVIYYDGETGFPYLKRFCFEPVEKRMSFIGEEKNEIISYTFDHEPQLTVIYNVEKGKKKKDDEVFHAAEFVAVKGIGAKGKRLAKHKIITVSWMSLKEPESEHEQSEIVNDKDDMTEQEKTDKSTNTNSKSMDDDKPLQMELEI
ncbi:MAG: DNA gyrase/topoisomerase IV subunit A [Bacteroidales bacterium]|nr:DNA gyrase/topoisomerase IV subunit A [Bacteroidales bacterium]